VAISSFAHLLLQAGYCDYQIGAFENFHQLVEDTLVVLRLGPKVFFQYELRFANRLECKLLIGHVFLPIKQTRPC
jgi:tagatose-1,6-bisphosphate aldolase non-catalytic subunit AgaZ/GatZ